MQTSPQRASMSRKDTWHSPLVSAANTPSRTAVRDPPPSSPEPKDAVSDGKKTKKIAARPAHHPKTAAAIWKLHLPTSALAQLRYQSSVPTVVGLSRRCARLPLCHCCVFSTSGFTLKLKTKNKTVPLSANVLHWHSAAPGSGSSAAQSPIHRVY